MVTERVVKDRVGSTELVGSTVAALDDAAQAIAAVRANLIAVSRKQAVTDALDEALESIKSAKANLWRGAEGGTEALQQNLAQAIAELEAEIAGIDDRLCPCCFSCRCKAQPVRQQPVWAPFSKKKRPQGGKSSSLFACLRRQGGKVAPARMRIGNVELRRASSRDSSCRESSRDSLGDRTNSWL